ncbi:SulP family sulfate permease [Bradyrhizobium japonicum]|jgi:sulfate permease, SulP family|uniref:SulP family inorganic anion transporter n=1 Tax=Bradyrhizobium TaxID=374 RepID=UPI0003603D55|nr:MULTISPECIES: SulP family inorganic anion transporter [Bradyrhizobium]MCP1730248.1 high affinity sulfate transporter 1 [Bradyrhizobium elkanii]MCP1930705.1 high affinity sulfate transporter 1 [Bradyrhizobium elkanii]MCS3481071.1 high affinity sulfate transporter 1 [Bradyrhizobium elkanii]MCS3517879.1 high affinity sulfate transporter 1 [Bradyrhizobium elkanii]MCS3574377.1 high affinity sulfate transporter 1 [Bradyrhizobium elkanii]
MSIQAETSWMRWFPPANWLADYRASWLGADAIAGVTLAAYAIPVSLAYAGLAGLPPQIGVYGYLLGGAGYALLGSSRQLAVGPTSAISLMIAGAVGILAGGDAARYGQIASLVAFSVAVLCLIAWLFKLSLLVRLISDSILVGFKAGAGLTIIMSQLPSLFGVAGGGHNFFDRVIKLAGQLGDTRPLVLGIGVAATVLLLLGEKRLPGKPVGLAVVALSILAASAFGLAELGLPVTGPIPTGLPTISLPTFGLLEFDDLFPIAAGCLVLAYVEGVSAARSFAAKHGYALDVRQEFLGLGAANLAAAFGHGYPVAGGLSQSAVNDAAGARTPLALVFCSATLALCLLFFTGLLTNLPKTVLAAIVFSAVYKLVDIAALARMWRISRIDFYAAIIALVSVLFLGILQGVLLAAVASIFLLLLRASQPNIAFLGRQAGSGRYSDRARHDDVEPLTGIIAFRPETSLLYVNAETIFETVLAALRTSPDVKLVACDLSASPFIDLAGSRMLHDLHQELASRQITFCIVGAHAQLRDLLRADGLADKTDSGDWMRTLDSVLSNRKPQASI